MVVVDKRDADAACFAADSDRLRDIFELAVAFVVAADGRHR